MNKKILSNKKLLRKIGFIVIGVLFLLIIGVVVVNAQKVRPVDKNNTETVIFKVESGAQPLDVTNNLYEEELIRNADTFYEYFLNDPSRGLFANNYELSQSMSSEEIFNIITSPESNVNMDDVNKLLIYEGEGIQEISKEVADVLDIKQKKVLDYWADPGNLSTWIEQYSVLTEDILNEDIIYPLEGYLYPATYIISDDETLETLTVEILNTTQEQYSPYIGQEYKNGYSFHEVLSLASIVERETIHDIDRPKVSQVFYNRIDKGMPLQSDITVLYGMGEHKEIVTYEDLEYVSPYNTYMYEGIPPSPISSVSAKALEATIFPEENDYLYFFAKKNSGEILYSETLEKHEEVSAKYAWE